MKKLVLFIAILLSIKTSVYAQVKFAPHDDTVRNSVYGDAWKIHNDVLNTSSIQNDSITISWKVISNDFPNSWKSSNYTGICDNMNCTSGIPSSSTTQTGTKFAPGTKMDFYMTMVPDSFVENGTHYVTIEMSSDGFANKKTMTFAVSKFATGVSTVNKVSDAVSMYPNPASNELNVIFSETAGIKNIAIYNLIGKPVMVYKVTASNSAKLNIESIPSGVYFVRLIDGQGRITAIKKITHY